MDGVGSCTSNVTRHPSADWVVQQQLAEAENQIMTHYQVFDQRPSDRELLTEAVAAQRKRLGRVPRLVTADAGYYAQTHEQAIEDMGVKWVAVPNRNTRSAERKKKEVLGSKRRKRGGPDVKAASAS